MFFDHMMSNAAAKVSGLTQGVPEVIAAIIHNLQSAKPHRILKFNICVDLPCRQFEDYVEIHVTLSHDVQCCHESVWTHLRGGGRSDRGNNKQFTM